MAAVAEEALMIAPLATMIAVEDPTGVEIREAVARLEREIGHARAVRTRILHGETNATVARSQKVTTAALVEAGEHLNVEDSKIEIDRNVAVAVAASVVGAEGDSTEAGQCEETIAHPAVAIDRDHTKRRNDLLFIKFSIGIYRKSLH